MQSLPSVPPKPVSIVWRPELVRLPRLHWPRRMFRACVRSLARGLIALLTDARISDVKQLPDHGAALIVMNHLGDTDTALVLAALPRSFESLGKIELLDEYPVLGRLMEWYGTIWVHRGKPDRRALRCALQALEEGRLVVVAPEGRCTLTGGLEEGQSGAAWLAEKANVPIIPMALTGTQNEKVYGTLRGFRRPHIALAVGEPFRLNIPGGHSPPLHAATRRIMETLARMLPPEYRGVYGTPPVA